MHFSKFYSILLFLFILPFTTYANDYLIKMKNDSRKVLSGLQNLGNIEKLGIESWVKLNTGDNKGRSLTLEEIRKLPFVEYAQPNYPVHLLNNHIVKDPILLNMAQELSHNSNKNSKDPNFPEETQFPIGDDPLFSNQWGMKDIGVQKAWKISKGNNVVVAVIDTGVDYTHQDLAGNMWTNSGEMGLDQNGNDKRYNGIDDDGNGFIDDVVGWDFVTDDNKPYDITVGLWTAIFSGGNLGHGTHCAGNVGAIGNNSTGISGVAPNVKIMAVRFLSEKGMGTTAGAIKSIKYAVDNGAQILSNSWGSEGEDPDAGEENRALQESIRYAMEKNVLFVAAAGNGHQGIGYDNDTDSKPGYPASYDIDNIVSVAAINSSDKLGRFSNWGNKSVDLAAPGVKIFSTIPGNKYQDTIAKLLGATWDGTSMATPHVSGAAALYLQANPNASWKHIKDALIKSARPVSSLQGKVFSGGTLNLDHIFDF